MQSDLKLPTFGRMGGAGHTTSYINGPERGRFVLRRAGTAPFVSPPVKPQRGVSLRLVGAIQV